MALIANPEIQGKAADIPDGAAGLETARSQAQD